MAELVGDGATADATQIKLPAAGGPSGPSRRSPGPREGPVSPGTRSPTSTPTPLDARGARARCGYQDDTSARARRSGDGDRKQGDDGHTLGAAGAIEAIMTIQTISGEACVPPTST